MYDVVTIGNATIDVILQSDVFKVHRDDTSSTGSSLVIPFGSKHTAQSLEISAGGGALNAAITFARQGFNTAVAAELGEDFGADNILKTLKVEGISETLIYCDSRAKSPLSAILRMENGERTVVAYRRLQHTHMVKSFPLTNLPVNWLYVTSLAGDEDLFKKVVNHAKKYSVKVAMNPGKAELKAPFLKNYLPDIDVLLLNREEAHMLFPKSRNETGDIFRSFREKTAATVIITNGARGAAACYQDTVYYIPAVRVEVVDRLGAGDAFGSGFVAGLIKTDDVKYALQLASSNAAAVCASIGANTGILRAHQKVQSLPVTERRL